MENKKIQISESLVRILMLRFLDSLYPNLIYFKELKMGMGGVIQGFSQKIISRVLSYLKEKGYIEGKYVAEVGNKDPEWFTVKITAEGIDHLEQLEDDIRLQVEEAERQIGFRPYSQQQKKRKEE